jgi:hypothetical protein
MELKVGGGGGGEGRGQGGAGSGGGHSVSSESFGVLSKGPRGPSTIGPSPPPGLLLSHILRGEKFFENRSRKR